MTLPEQLQLDFSTAESQAPAPHPAVAQVHRLADYRAAQSAKRLSSAYAAIFESIKHIDVRRKCAPADRDSRFC